MTPTLEAASGLETSYPAPAMCSEVLQRAAVLLQTEILDSKLSDLFLQIRTGLVSMLRLSGAEEASASAGTAVVDIPVSPHIGLHTC